MAARKQKAPPAVEATQKASRPTVSDTTGDDLGAAEMNRRVSEALRRHRKQRDLSLDQLALKTGVSRAALSQIEGARTNPTLSVLWKIAAGLGIALQELLEMPNEEAARVLRASDVVVLRSADGRMESRLLSPSGAANGVETYELRIAPKGILRSEPHRKGTTETLIVLKGVLRLSVGTAEYELGVGDTGVFQADVPHSYENRSSHEARLINVIAYERA